ncbi:hypothetical protein Mapa_006476 [Marchantia paleacea]|nr:hypothetical protein Mapa_006476 [Marchantia paleacea]
MVLVKNLPSTSAAFIPAGTWKSLVSSGSEACTFWKVRKAAIRTRRTNEETGKRPIFENAVELQDTNFFLEVLKILKMVQPLADVSLASIVFKFVSPQKQIGFSKLDESLQRI